MFRFSDVNVYNRALKRKAIISACFVWFLLMLAQIRFFFSRTQTVESARAEAEKIKMTGAAEAYAIEAVGKADAERMRLRAAAYKQYDEAAVLSLVLDTLPKLAAEVSLIFRFPSATSFLIGLSLKSSNSFTQTLKNFSSREHLKK